MTGNIIGYLIEASIYLTFCWLVYRCILSRFTFFQLNRYFLLTSLFVSLLLPVTPNLFEIELNTFQSDFVSELIIIETTGELTEIVSHEALNLTSNSEKNNNYTEWIITFFKVGVLLFTVRFIWIFTTSVNIILSAEKRKIENYSIYFHSNIKEPCSLFSKILFPKSWEDKFEDIPQEILKHEKAHSTENHWIDLILVEFITVFFWFLPFIYFIRKSINLNLEFLADRAVLKHYSLESYQLQLLNEIQPKTTLAFSHTFYSTPIKTRFKMMKKTPTSIWKKTVYGILTILFIVPTVALTPNKITAEKLAVAPLVPSNIDIIYSLPNESEYYPDYFPVEKEKLYRLASGFGMRLHPITKERKLHTGLDFSAPIGAKVYAVAAGTVKIAEDSGKKGYGNRVDIQHGETEYLSRYAQLNEYIVKVGQTVKKGEVIGYVGSSGMSTAPHLHFELRKNGKAIDPIKYIHPE